MAPLVYEQESSDFLWCLMSNVPGDQELQPVFWLCHLPALTTGSGVGDQGACSSARTSTAAFSGCEAPIQAHSYHPHESTGARGESELTEETLVEVSVSQCARHSLDCPKSSATYAKIKHFDSSSWDPGSTPCFTN